MSFQIALSGLNAINDQLDTISNNIANTGTTGFKSGRVNFASMYAGQAPNGVETGSVTQTLEVGGGRVTTGRSLDVSIQGRGYFIARDTSGVVNYTRAGIFDIDKSGHVVDNLGRNIQGYGVVPGATALGPMGDLRVPNGQIAAQASSLLTYGGNLSADWQTPVVAPFNATDPQSYNSSIVSVVYDSLGAQHTVTQYFVKTGTNQIDVHYGFDGAAVPTVTSLAFAPTGLLTAPVGTAAIALPAVPGANPLAVGIDYSGTTQYAGDTTTTANAADGYASGSLVSVQIDDDGSVQAQYSNGQRQLAGTVALATFASESGLVPVDNTSWVSSNKSGLPLIGAPGTGQVGELASGALEQSNVDITHELVDLMGAQRSYQANTKVISTENEMMQSLMQAL